MIFVSYPPMSCSNAISAGRTRPSGISAIGRTARRPTRSCSCAGTSTWATSATGSGRTGEDKCEDCHVEKCFIDGRILYQRRNGGNGSGKDAAHSRTGHAGEKQGRQGHLRHPDRHGHRPSGAIWNRNWTVVRACCNRCWRNNTCQTRENETQIPAVVRALPGHDRPDRPRGKMCGTSTPPGSGCWGITPRATCERSAPWASCSPIPRTGKKSSHRWKKKARSTTSRPP